MGWRQCNGRGRGNGRAIYVVNSKAYTQDGGLGDPNRLLHVYVCRVIDEQDSKRGLEVGGSDGGAARLDNSLLATIRLYTRSGVGVCAHRGRTQESRAHMSKASTFGWR